MDNGCFWNLSIVGLGDLDLSVLSVQGVLGEGQEVRVGVAVKVGWDTVVDHGGMGVTVMVVHHRSGVQTGVVVVDWLMVVHSGWQRLHQVVVQVVVHKVAQMVIIVDKGGTVPQMDASYLTYTAATIAVAVAAAMLLMTRHRLQYKLWHCLE